MPMHKILHLTAKINSDEATPQAPEWVLLFKSGLGKLADGIEFLVDDNAYQMVKEFIAARGNDVHFDYEHASLERQPAPAAGWIKELVWEEETGIKAKVEWTQKASEFIAAKEYRYFSPVFYIRKADKRVCGLDSVALTNRPRTTYLTPILARLEAELESKMETEKMADNPQTKEPQQETPAQPSTSLPQEIIAALELKPEDGISAIVASIHALKQHQANGVVSRQEFEALQAKLTERDATDAVIAAMSQGKITPSQKDWAVSYAKSDLAGFQMFVAKAPAVVPVGELQGQTKTPLQGDNPTPPIAIDEETRQVARMMGVSAEDIKKYGSMEVTNG